MTPLSSPATLTVLFDETCALCVQCRDWLHVQDKWVHMDFVPCHSKFARDRYGAVPWLGQELVVVSERGEVWAGAAAFIMCLWSLKEWREWSYRLSGSAFAPLAERFFQGISGNRKSIASWIGRDECEGGSCNVAQRRARIAYR